MSAGAAIATSHATATDVGARILAAGGTAVDAAIAAAATLCVVYPNNVALGGDLVALVREPSGRTTFVNATGPAARAETRDALAARHPDGMPSRGVDTVTIPGAVRGWKALAALGGALDWETLLTPARAAARDGHPVARSVGAAIALELPRLGRFAGWSDVFAPGGRALVVGDPLVQPALAETLDVLARRGPDAFYEGELAERWIAGLGALGSRLTPAEVAAFAPELSDPIHADVLGHRVVTSPPNTQGFALLRTLRHVEREGLGDPLGADAARLARLFHDANAIRRDGLADPRHGATAAELIAREPGGATAEGGGTAPGRAPRGDTVGLTVVADGWAVSLVQSVFEAFGSGVLDPGTGILFQNRGSAFSLDPHAAGAFAGGRRPPHTLMPVLVERDGALAYALATMGGQAQPQIHAQLLLRLLDGATAAEATSAPRWVVGHQDDDDTPDTLSVEEDVATTTRAALDRSGLTVKPVPPRWELCGHSNLVRVTPDGLDAASDPRSDGAARVLARGADR